MSRVGDYRDQLQALALDEWEGFLRAESHLPGPRGNLELAAAVAELAPPDWIYAHIATTEAEAPESTPASFVVDCATQGLGRLAAEGDDEAIAYLQVLAADDRWRVRESVAMALQRLGDRDFERLLTVAERRCGLGPLEQRAAAAGLCEPRLLKDARSAVRVFGVLDRITDALESALDRRNDAFRALRQGMGYCWSVAVAAYPDAGKPAFEAWLTTEDADVRRVLRENLKKNRLIKMDPDWVDACRRLLG